MLLIEFSDISLSAGGGGSTGSNCYAICLVVTLTMDSLFCVGSLGISFLSSGVTLSVRCLNLIFFLSSLRKIQGNPFAGVCALQYKVEFVVTVVTPGQWPIPKLQVSIVLTHLHG